MTERAARANVHFIRLAGVWEVAARDPEPDPALWERVRLDRLENGAPFVPIVCRRRFGRPTNLADGQPVSLEVSGMSVAAEIRLNGRTIVRCAGPAETIRVRIEEALAQRNELLVVAVRCDDTTPSANRSDVRWPFRECRLAIEDR